MPLSREVDEKYIIEKLAQIQSMVYLSNQQQLYDIDHVLEDFCTGLLNVVFEWNLHNINAETKNSPAIDLGDPDNKIAVQITSDRSGKKVRDTVDKFIQHGLYKAYTRLVVVILVPKQERYEVEIDTKEHLIFSKRNDILDFADIIENIKSRDVESISSVRGFIEKEFPDSYPPINWESYDRIKDIIRQIESGHEREAALDIELLFNGNIADLYNELMRLVNEQADRREFLDFYDQQLRSILADESREEEYDILVAQSEQNDYYEYLYDFCSGYSFMTVIPYDRTRQEVIDFRKEHLAMIEREKKIIEARTKCIQAIKTEAGRLIRR